MQDNPMQEMDDAFRTVGGMIVAAIIGGALLGAIFYIFQR